MARFARSMGDTAAVDRRNATIRADGCDREPGASARCRLLGSLRVAHAAPLGLESKTEPSASAGGAPVRCARYPAIHHRGGYALEQKPRRGSSENARRRSKAVGCRGFNRGGRGNSVKRRISASWAAEAGRVARGVGRVTTTSWGRVEDCIAQRNNARRASFSHSVRVFSPHARKRIP
jgi:hypothetical protein